MTLEDLAIPTDLLAKAQRIADDLDMIERELSACVYWTSTWASVNSRPASTGPRHERA